jgi:RHS repeat-associated protein
VAAGEQPRLNLEHRYGKQPSLIQRNRSDTLGNSTTRTENFHYDAEQRLTRVETEGWLWNDNETFTLDEVGNRTGHSMSANPWEYDQNNRLVKIGAGACGTSNTICFEYDEAGNRTRKIEENSQTRYHYDTQNRLSEVRRNEQLVARYGYDPFNRRLWKEQYRDKTGQLARAGRTYFLYSDEGLLAEEEQAIVLNPDESVTAAGMPKITAQYGPKPDNPFTTGILFVRARNTNGAETVAYYHHDHLGTPILATDKHGNTVWSAKYDAFGKATITTPEAMAEKPTITSNLRLPGQYEDGETGLHYNWNRYYSSKEGRYVTADPIGLEGGINTYSYVNGNPLRFVDPTGFICFYFNKFVNQIEQNRADSALTLGSLVMELSVGTMPKTTAELRGFGVPKTKLNPYTSQLSRWSGRLGIRALRLAGRTTAGIIAGTVATVSVVLEGFYDWGVIGKAAWDATSLDECDCQKQ